ncbi:MAG: ATP-binding protein [Bacteroidota bacterium]
MDLFYLTTAALPRLSLVVLTSGVLVYFVLRARKTVTAAWMALALLGFVLHHIAYVGFGTIYVAQAWRWIEALTWSSVIVSTWAFIGVADHFGRVESSRTSIRLLVACGGLALLSITFIHLAGGRFLPVSVPWTVIQAVGTITVLSLGLTATAVLVWRRREYLAVTDSEAQRDRMRKATRTFIWSISMGLLIPISGVLRDTGVVSYQLDEQVTMVLWAVVMMLTLTLYVNYDAEPTSLLVKVVAFGFLSVVTALGVGTVLAFSTPLPIRGDAPPAVRFVPDAGGYRVEAAGAFDGQSGEPLGITQSRSATVPLGFDFPYAGQTWDEVHVDDDGYVLFGPDRIRTFLDLSRGTSIPWIAPLVTRLSPTDGDMTIRRDSASATVTWNAVPLTMGSGTASVQLALFRDGSIEMRYGEVGAPGAVRNSSNAWLQGISPGKGERPQRTRITPGMTVEAGAAVADDQLADWLEAEERRATPYAWLLLGSGLAVLLAFPLYLREGLTRPLKRLLDGVRLAARGHLEARVPVGARDEIGVLTEDFNRMTDALQRADVSLRTYADELEERVEERTAELAQSLDELKEAQARLVQQEKLASLGQLTAGIAHEIKNPLNFVTNFADLSVELAQEAAGEDDPEERAALLADLLQNATKIAEHGRRADTIVQGMMAHARARGGKRQQVDLDELVAEYAALAYHGMRARHPGANVTFGQELGDAGMIDAVPGDLGRVIINVLDNAFDAVRQQEGRVVVSTSLSNGRALVRVEDDGVGMPEEVRAKVFEPFFTTKPTGQGTGLGLSLAYDIVTQGHGGTLSVESEPGQGTAFVLSLPVAANEKRPRP